MPKKYRLLIDSPELRKGTVITQEKDGSYSYKYTYMFNETITEGRRHFCPHEIEDRPNMWQLIEEPKQSFKRWRAEYQVDYYYVSSGGVIIIGYDSGKGADNYHYLTGNYFQTEQEAQTYKARQEAIGRVTHAIIEANEGQRGNYAIVWRNGKYDTLLVDYERHNTTVPLSMPPVLSEDIALSIISSHKEDLDLIFNLKK